MNGVPLRRVNQAFVIATSTKVDVSGVKLPAELSATERTAEAKFFKAEKAPLGKGKEGFLKFQASLATKGAVPEAKKALQAGVDAAIKLDATLKAYLKDVFALSKGDKPHAMKF